MTHGAFMLLARDRRLLVLRREDDDPALFKGIWDVPGGIVEAGEEALEAAVRETEEETGLRVAVTEALRDWEHDWSDGGRFRVTTFIGWEYHGELRLSSEHSAYAWMTPQEILDQGFGEHRLRSPVFRSWLDGWTVDLRLFAERVTARSPRRRRQRGLR